nr:GumC family protein [Roseibium denhamense]
MLIRGFLRHWILVAICIVAGVLLISAFLMSLTRTYTADTSLYFDPRQLLFNVTGQADAVVPPQTIESIIDSQIQLLRSDAVLERVVARFDLEEDAEFNSGARAGDETFAVVSALKEAVSTYRDGGSYLVSLGVKTKDPMKSAILANGIADEFIAFEKSSVNQVYSGLTDALTTRLEVLAANVRAADTAVDEFRAQNDLVTAKGDLISEDRLLSLNQALLTAQQKTIEAQANLNAVSTLDLNNAVSGNLDNSVASSTLVDLRRQYASASSNVASLEAALGARHPSLSAARAALSGIQSQIRSELQRIVAAAQSELERAQREQEEISKELQTQKALSVSNAPNQGILQKLELEAETARSLYEAVLKRMQESTENQNIGLTNVRIVAYASAPLTADGPGRLSLLIAGIVGGALFGFTVAAFIIVVRLLYKSPALRSYFRDPETA